MIQRGVDKSFLSKSFLLYARNEYIPCVYWRNCFYGISKKNKYLLSGILFLIKFLMLFLTILGISKKVFAQENQFDISKRGYASNDYNISQNDSGYVLVVWYDQRNSSLFEGYEFAGAVYGQILDPNLNPIGSNFRISKPIENGHARQPDVQLLNNGRYIVVWNESVRTESGNSSQRRIVMTMRTLDGKVVIPETTVDENPEQVTVSSPSIYKLSDKKLLVTWNEPRDSHPSSFGQYFFTNGESDGENLSLAHPTLDLSPSGIHIVNDEMYFLSYLDAALVNDGNQWIQYYDSTHTRIGEPVQLEQQGRITPFGADSILVAFNSDDMTQLHFQFLDAKGKVLSNAVPINDDGGIHPKTAPKVARNPSNGSFVIIWQDGRNGLPISGSFTVLDVYAQRFNATGNPVGANFKVNYEAEEHSQLEHKIQYRSDNTYLITWWDSRLILCPPPPPGTIVGGVSDSYITATLLEYDHPDPAPVWGWVDPETRCENYNAPIPFEVKQNYPNPFNRSTNIVIEVNTRFVIDFEIEIYNSIGRKVKHIRREKFGQGTHHIPFDGTGLPSGLYIARIRTPHAEWATQTTTMLFIK